MSKSLSESAAEILSASLNGAAKAPMPNGGAQYDDLGGATPTDDYSTKNQSGDTGTDPSVGKTVSSKAKTAAMPGNANAPRAPMIDQKAKAENPAEVNAQFEETEASDESLVEEEAELTEEEIEAYLDSLTEEELAALAEEVDQIDEMGSVKLPINNGSKAPLKKTLPQASSVANPKMAEEVEMTEEQIAEARAAAVKALVQKNMTSCKEDVDALFNGESLSEEFRTKATTIFEAAVRARVEAIATEIVSENEQILSDSVAEIQEDLSEQVDSYLNHVVESWMEENQVAIETGLKVEITEDFISGLKNLFAEHYIEVPEDKADVVEEMAAAVTAAEEQLAEQAEVLAATTKALNEAKATEILRKICEGLTEVQVSKIKSLAEGVEFTTDGEYTEKLFVIRENYFPTGKVRTAAPEVVVETEEKGTSNAMDYYVNAITKQLPK